MLFLLLFGLLIRIKHIVLQEDGVSDPPGIKVRALEGLKGCAYLETSNRATKVWYNDQLQSSAHYWCARTEILPNDTLLTVM
jgi:hypothetical protein